jgi:hypothetical protein
MHTTRHRGWTIVIAALLAVTAAACGSPKHVATRDESSTTTSLSGSTSTSDAATSTTGSEVSSTTTTAASTDPSTHGNQPLWPFRTAQEAADWQASYRSGGHQPWHLSPSESALSFTRGYLGYTDIDLVTATRTDAAGAHVSVGYLTPNNDKHTAAVIHLFRWGSGSDAPWEVAGTDDTDFTLTQPGYGTIVHSPTSVGGRLTGVDDNIKVFVRQPSSSSPIGTFCCQPAGGDRSPWSATVSFNGASDPLLTIAASTGGHLKGVERFTVTGVRH